MISDNFVVGDNVYLNELKNFFFEVLGMMSVTHYGAIGDCRTDNYASLQVAIDDANRRGLCYIYVPYGRYRFRGNLINRENITFIGNPRAKIFNDRTGEEIEIKQFGVPCCGGGKVKSVITVTNSSAVRVGDGTDQGNIYMVNPFPFDTVLAYCGSNLTFDKTTGKITIGSDINYIKVSANVYFSTLDNSFTYDNAQREVAICKKGEGAGTYIQRHIKPSPNIDDSTITANVAIASTLIQVSEGDEVFLRVMGGADDTLAYTDIWDSGQVFGDGTFLTVEGIVFPTPNPSLSDEVAYPTIGGDNTPNPENSEHDNENTPNPTIGDNLGLDI